MNLPEAIEIWPVNRPQPYSRNARTHDAAQVEKIAASMLEFGFTNPILVDANDTIIAGHGRLMAAKHLGRTEVPVIVLGHLTDAQRRAYILADNRLALDAGWDMEMLAAEVAALDAEDFDLSLTGFSDDELADLLLDDEGDTEPEGDPDETPDPPEKPVILLGDVWLLAGHRLMCGDSTSEESVSELMAGDVAELVFTDPPYGVEYQSNMRTKSERFDVLKNDDTFLDITPIVSKFSHGWVFVWTSWEVQTRWIDLFSEYGYPTNIVIWHKPGGGIGDLKKTFLSDYEVALVWHRGAELCGKRIGSVWTINKDGASTYVHPTQKPVALGVEAIDKTTTRGAIVLDLFGGSGSTLMACEQTKRNARLMELDPRYADVIVKRWEAHTGKQAVLEATGQTFSDVMAERLALDAVA